MAVKVADAFVAVGADMSAYNKTLKTEGAKGAQGLAQTVKGILRGFGGADGTGANIKAFVSDLRAGKVSMADLRDQAAIAGTTLRSAFSTGTLKLFHGGLNGVKSVLGGLKGIGADILKGFSIGVGIGSFQALGRVLSDIVGIIPDLIHKGEDYIHSVALITYATGASAQSASRFAGVLLYLGTPLGLIPNLLGQMSRNLELTEPRMNALGVTTRDANGGLLDQVTILENARRAFQAFGSGTEKADQIAREFGRGGVKALTEFLMLTDEQFNLVVDDLQKQGLILSQAQIDLAETSAREGDRFQNALTGLGATLFTVVGPQIVAFMSNLTTTIEEHVTEITDAISKAISFILGLVSTLISAGDSLDSFSAGIIRAGEAANPYSARIAEINVELSKMGTTAVDTAGIQKKAIQGQIDALGKEETALKKLDATQDKQAKHAIDLLYRELDAQNKLLDAEDKAIANADRDLALTEALRQAKIKLFEAQAQLRQDTIDNAKITDPTKRKSTDQDVLDIAKAQQDVVDAQKAIGEEAVQRSHDQRRAELAAVKDYIASVAKLLDDADNKKAALNTLKRRQTVLEAREAAALAAGDTQKAADLHLEVEAVKTTETRAQQQIRNGLAQTALDKQKAQLQAELANVRSTSEQATAIKRVELEKQLKAAIAQEAAWAKLTGKERDDTQLVTQALNAPKASLVAALKDARDAGKDFGATLKTAFGDVVTVLGQIIDFLGQILALKATLVGGPGDSNFNRALADYNRTHHIGSALTGGAPGRGSSLPSTVTNGLGVLGPSSPALSPAGATSGSGSPVIVRVEVGGNKLIDYIDKNLQYRRR